MSLHHMEKIVFFFFSFYYICMRRWILAECIVVIISQLMYFKPSCSVPQTYKVMYVNYMNKSGKTVKEVMMIMFYQIEYIKKQIEIIKNY